MGLGLYSIRKDPGLWSAWLRKPENKKLPIMEAKKKYLKEQLDYQNQQNFFIAQKASRGVVIENGVETVAFGEPDIQSISANAPYIDVGFKLPVVVTGNPTITVNNSQAGSGSAATFTYTYGTGSGSDVLRFAHTHPAYANNNGGLAAAILREDAEILASATTLPTSPDEDLYVGETMTYAQGSGGTGGSNVTATIRVGASGITSIIITDNGIGRFSPGNTLTLAGSNLGGSGNLIVTIRKEDLVGDVITIPAQTINLAGGTIKTFGNNPKITDSIRRKGAVPTLTIPESNQASKTVVAS